MEEEKMLTLEKFEEASEIVKRVTRPTKLIYSEYLSSQTGGKVYLKPEQWDAKRRRVRNHPNADAINRMIYEYMAEIEKKELGLWQQRKTVTLDALKEALVSVQEEEESFLAFFRKEIINSRLKESTKQNHLSTLELLREYKKDVSFTELTFEFISSFDQYLQAKGYHVNTIAKHMKHLKRHINTAINKEYMEIQN